MGMGVRAVANDDEKKSPSRGHFFLSLLARSSALCVGTIPKDVDPSLPSLSTFSLSLSERRRYQREDIQARKDPELASQAPLGR